MVQHSGVDPFFGWGQNLEKWHKKKLPRFARKVPVSNFSRVGALVTKMKIGAMFCGIFMLDLLVL